MQRRGAVLSVFAAAVVLAGCASRVSTVRTETDAYPSGSVYASNYVQHHPLRPGVSTSVIDVDPGPGMAIERRTTTTTTAPPVVAAPPGTVVDERTTTTEVVEEEPQGLLSGLFNIVGEIIALPFRIVGGIIQAIF